jgi:hypothetical protein
MAQPGDFGPKLPQTHVITHLREASASVANTVDISPASQRRLVFGAGIAYSFRQVS